MNHVSNPCPRYGGVGGKCMCYATRNKVNFFALKNPVAKTLVTIVPFTMTKH